MIKTKEKQIMVKEMAKCLKELLKKNIVGVVREETENVFLFYLPGGKTFRIYVEENRG